jgi:hypothetical protein
MDASSNNVELFPEISLRRLTNEPLLGSEGPQPLDVASDVREQTALEGQPIPVFRPKIG